jgi:hypothetical protein
VTGAPDSWHLRGPIKASKPHLSPCPETGISSDAHLDVQQPAAPPSISHQNTIFALEGKPGGQDGGRRLELHGSELMLRLAAL